MKAKPRKQTRRNPVARHAAQFVRAVTFRDRTKYRRHDKYKGREPYPVGIVFGI